MPTRRTIDKSANRDRKAARNRQSVQISQAARAVRAAQEAQVERIGQFESYGSVGQVSPSSSGFADDSPVTPPPPVVAPIPSAQPLEVGETESTNSGPSATVFTIPPSQPFEGGETHSDFESVSDQPVGVPVDVQEEDFGLEEDDMPTSPPYRGDARDTASARGSRSATRSGSQPRSRQGRLQPRYVKRTITRWRMAGVAAFAVIMLVGGLVGMAFFARPTTSTVENRNLTTFPELTLSGFVDGSFFTDVSLWYADTYPLREPMVSADHWVDGFYGVSTGTAMYGNANKGDEIPTDDDGAEIELPTAPPDEHAIAQAVQDNLMDGIYVSGGVGYSICYFSQHAADTYIAAMNEAAERLDGVSTVYSIISPANSIMLDPEEAESVGGADQQEVLDYLRTRFDKRVKSVELVDDVEEHRDEYIYFHTDHHWTQLGAHYAYEAFCDMKGVEPSSLSSMKSVDIGDFAGSYYDTIVSSGATPQSDDLVAYIPNGTNKMTYTDLYGGENTGSIVDKEAAGWDLDLKYSCYIAGDQPFTMIENPKVDDGSSCLVVKDSFGCAFVPNLVDDYQTIYVMDYRKIDENICDFALEHEVQDVLFVTGAKLSLSDAPAELIYSLVVDLEDQQDQQGEQD